MRPLFTLLIAAAVLAPTPAPAQTVFPMLAAMRFCELRRLGVSQSDSIKAAVRDAFSTASPVMVSYKGELVDSNHLLFLKNAVETCPEAF